MTAEVKVLLNLVEFWISEVVKNIIEVVEFTLCYEIGEHGLDGGRLEFTGAAEAKQVVVIELVGRI